MVWTDVEEDSEDEEEDEEVGEEVDEEDSGSEEGSDEDEEEEWAGLGDPEPDHADEKANNIPTPAPETIPGSEKPAPGMRYVVPHLRNRQGGQETEELSEEQIKLQRQLKGLLNRMSEQNISAILDSAEEIYSDHRRHGTSRLFYTACEAPAHCNTHICAAFYTDVTSTLTTLVVDGISSHSMHLDSYVVLHAAFVAALHKIIGVEFGTYP